MSIESVLSVLDESAKDIKLNFKKLMEVEDNPLGENNIAVIYATAIALNPSSQMREVISELESHLDEKTIYAAKIASAIMSMNNIYYRYTHLSEDESLMKLPAGLRMQSMRQHEVDTVLFELMSLAISALNGCGMCIQAHIRTLQKHEVDQALIHAAGKVAGVVNALNQVTMLS